MSQEFDRYSKNYKTLMEDAIKITGFNSSYFVTAKLKKLRSIEGHNISSNFLDYGCGLGDLSKNFHQYFPNARYFGVDASPEMVKTARDQYGGNGIFCESSSEEWKQRSYQTVFSACAFHHIPPENHKNVLSTLKDLLTPGGKIIIWEHNPINPFTRKIVRDCPFDEHAVLIHPNRLMNMFNQAGLRQTRLIYTTFFPKFLQFLTPAESMLEWCPFGGQYILIGSK